MTNKEQEQRISKARQLRYKKAIALEMNCDDITTWLYNMQDALNDVLYLEQNDDIFVDAFGGDEDEAFEFRVAFQSLYADIERFQDDLADAWIPEAFNDFFCAVSGHGAQRAGYDIVEEDYYGLDSFESELAVDVAAKRLERLSKHDLIMAAQRCYQVAVAYMGLRSRFEDLRAGVDILRAKNDGLLQAIEGINSLYDKWSAAEWPNKDKLDKQIDNMAAQLPGEVWLR